MFFNITLWCSILFIPVCHSVHHRASSRSLVVGTVSVSQTEVNLILTCLTAQGYFIALWAVVVCIVWLLSLHWHSSWNLFIYLWLNVWQPKNFNWCLSLAYDKIAYASYVKILHISCFREEKLQYLQWVDFVSLFWSDVLVSFVNTYKHTFIATDEV